MTMMMMMMMMMMMVVVVVVVMMMTPAKHFHLSTHPVCQHGLGIHQKAIQASVAIRHGEAVDAPAASMDHTQHRTNRQMERERERERGRERERVREKIPTPLETERLGAKAKEACTPLPPSPRGVDTEALRSARSTDHSASLRIEYHCTAHKEPIKIVTNIPPAAAAVAAATATTAT